MTGLDIAAIAILIFMVVFWFLGGWHGRVAAARNHPYKTAVTIAVARPLFRPIWE